MAQIVPTVTAYDMHEYRSQLEQVSGFAPRLHIDVMDGEFAPTRSPELERLWWPANVEVDLHLMYAHPMDHLQPILRLRPKLVIIHAEADAHHMHFVAELHKHGLEAGLALLAETSVAAVEQIIHSFDHVLIFSGHLGYHGGSANLDMLEKVEAIKALHPEASIGWDGGINDQNAQVLIAAGVQVLNVGGFIQKTDQPEQAYAKLKAIAAKT